MARFEPSRLTRDPAERTRFLAHLRRHGTIERAAAEIGVSTSTVHRLRKADRGFRDACAAIAGDPTAYMLEAALIGRAINGVPRTRTLPGGATETTVDYDHKLGWDLLRKLMPERYGDRPKPPLADGVVTRAELLAVLTPLEFDAARAAAPAATPGADGTVPGISAAAAHA